VRLSWLAVPLLLCRCAPQVVDAVDRLGIAGSGDGAAAGTGIGGALAVGGTAGAGGTGGDGSASPGEDRDADGTPDRDDACPDQPGKVQPGVCGCEIPDEDRPDFAGCLGLIRALAHRYSFDGTGDVARDTAGLVPGAAVDPTVAPADGFVINTLLTGSSSVRLAGGMNGNHDDDQYVTLPSGLISSFDSVTVEAWVTWYGGAPWQRIFDFGSNDSGVPGAQGPGGTSYLFLATSYFLDQEVDRVRAAYKHPDFGREVQVEATRPFPEGLETHVAVVLDGPNDALLLYLDGSLEDSASGAAVGAGIPMLPNLVEDQNNWLGRSQFVSDAELSASISELRIYSAPLTAAQIRTSVAAGADPPYFPHE
jgi:hypothetical protein